MLASRPLTVRALTNSGIRFQAVVATLIGALALGVSAYTAYVQRQQVRAQVWPVLEYGSDNEPGLRLWLANKGVGPAFIRHVLVTVDGKAIPNWRDAMELLLGPGKYSYAQSNISHRVLSPGETLSILSPRFEGGSQNPLWVRFNKERLRVGLEVCYCSTLGECWTLVAPVGQPERTDETRHCPVASDSTFKQ